MRACVPRLFSGLYSLFDLCLIKHFGQNFMLAHISIFGKRHSIYIKDITRWREDIACSAGVLLGRVIVTTLRPPIVHPLGRTFFLSPVFHCLKNSRWKQTFLRCERSHEKISPALQAREDRNFMFEWQEQYLTSWRSERVRYCFCHENIKFISSSQRAMFILLYGD